MAAKQWHPLWLPAVAVPAWRKEYILLMSLRMEW